MLTTTILAADMILLLNSRLMAAADDCMHESYSRLNASDYYLGCSLA